MFVLLFSYGILTKIKYYFLVIYGFSFNIIRSLSTANKAWRGMHTFFYPRLKSNHRCGSLLILLHVITDNDKKMMSADLYFWDLIGLCLRHEPSKNIQYFCRIELEHFILLSYKFMFYIVLLGGWEMCCYKAIHTYKYNNKYRRVPRRSWSYLCTR